MNEAKRITNDRYCRSEKGITTRQACVKRRTDAMREKITVIKEGTPCSDCGRHYPSYVMDFDHVRGEKFHPIARLMNKRYSWKTIEAEIAKCDVVCSNCHRIRTHQRRQRYGSRA